MGIDITVKHKFSTLNAQEHTDIIDRKYVTWDPNGQTVTITAATFSRINSNSNTSIRNLCVMYNYVTGQTTMFKADSSVATPPTGTGWSIESMTFTLPNETVAKTYTPKSSGDWSYKLHYADSKTTC